MRFKRRWWSLTDAEADRLNPPPDTEECEDWLTVGYIPRPATRLGWLFYHIVHGLWMRYPLHKVLGFALANTKQPEDVVFDWALLPDEEDEE